jgi:hypothetical protein
MITMGEGRGIRIVEGRDDPVGYKVRGFAGQVSTGEGIVR